MNRLLYDWLQEQRTIDLIDAGQWDRFYSELRQEQFTEDCLDVIGDVTDLLIDCGATFEGIKKIPQGFMCKSRKTQFTIPSSVTHIEDQAFIWSKLQSIVIPETVDSVEEWAFCECKNLKTIYVLNPYIAFSCDTFEDTAIQNVFYAGTEAEWDDIMFYPSNKDYTVHYLYRPI